MSKEKGLKPCPFCGTEAKMNVRRGFKGEIMCAFGYCPKCDARGGVYSTREGATQAWNGRTRVGAWIPASERLPTEEEYCKNDGRFIVTDGNRVEQGIFDVYADGYCGPQWPHQFCQPIAWTPLPEPYKAE